MDIGAGDPLVSNKCIVKEVLNELVEHTEDQWKKQRTDDIVRALLDNLIIDALNVNAQKKFLRTLASKKMKQIKDFRNKADVINIKDIYNIRNDDVVSMENMRNAQDTRNVRFAKFKQYISHEYYVNMYTKRDSTHTVDAENDILACSSSNINSTIDIHADEKCISANPEFSKENSLDVVIGGINDIVLKLEEMESELLELSSTSRDRREMMGATNARKHAEVIDIKLECDTEKTCRDAFVTKEISIECEQQPKVIKKRGKNIIRSKISRAFGLLFKQTLADQD